MRRPGLYDYGKLVDLPVERELVSLLAGQHRGERAGTSHEFLDMAEYKLGDDISDVDWKATARHGRPIVKRFEAAAVLSVYLVVDGGANMAALAGSGPNTGDLYSKKDVADEVCTAVSWLTARRSDHLGLVIGNEERVRFFPARSGFAHAETVVRAVAATSVDSPGPDVPRLLRRAETGLRRRSLLLLVTDRQQVTPHLVRSLRRLQTRHRVGVVLVDDFDPTADGGSAALADVRGGPLPRFVRGDPAIASQWAAVRGAEDARARALLDQARIPWAAAGTPAEVLPALITVLGGRGKRARRTT